MIEPEPPLALITHPLTSESRVFRRGGRVNGNNAEGRFLRRCEKELIAEISGNPTFSQMLMIKRCSMAMLRLQLLDEKMASGNWTDHDGRVFGGLNNAVRLFLKEIGLHAKTPSKVKGSDLSDIVSRHKAAAP